MKNNFFLIFVLMAESLFSQTITRLETVQSLYVEVYRDSIRLGNATGFVIRSKTRNYLVTNYHVVTNRNPIDNSWLDASRPISPNKIFIVQNAKELGEYVLKQEALLDNLGNPLWFQTKLGKEMVDVIELPLKDTVGIQLYPVNYRTSPYDSVLMTPTERVFILGFPFGIKSAPFFPIWKSGLIASEPDIDQEGKPIIWVDALTFPGMSGAPVYFMSNEMVTLRNGSSALIKGGSKFMGVFAYSHSLNVYGALWKATYLKQIFDKLP
jgi:hypothetical protein